MLQVEPRLTLFNKSLSFPLLTKPDESSQVLSKTFSTKREETQALRKSWKKQMQTPAINSNVRQNTSKLQVIKMPYLPERARTHVSNNMNIPQVKAERRKREISSAKYYTALTRRQKHKDPEPEVKALTDPHLPLPRLYGNSEALKLTPRKPSVREWEGEIKKNVPPRPKFAFEPDWPPPKSPDKKELYIRTQFPHFSRADRFAAQKREFVVNPEWFSEKIQRPFGYRYKTSVLRYGWIDRSVVM